MTTSANRPIPSVSFEPAAEYYDRTRRLPPEIMRKVVDALRTELSGQGRCLEIGVGTGRIALPLHAQGIRVVGIDVSPRMIAKLRENWAGEGRPPSVAVADATRLPFGASSFDAGLAVHVLHLIPAWTEALRQIVRVVRPGGMVLVDPGGAGIGWWRDLQSQFCREAGLSERYLGEHRGREVDEFMRALGAEIRLLPAVEGQELASPDERIRQLEEGIFSYTWRLESDARRRAGAAVRRWAEEELGSLSNPRAAPIRVTFHAYDLPR